MEINIQAGLKGKQELTVSPEKTAATYGSGLVEVYATPAMIAFMEQTSHLTVAPYLPAEAMTVGTSVDIVHTKATPVGMKVICESELLEVNGRELVFSVIARDEQGEIGRGTHKRFVVDREKFMSKLPKV